MGPNVPIWAHMGPYEPHMGPHGPCGILIIPSTVYWVRRKYGLEDDALISLRAHGIPGELTCDLPDIPSKCGPQDSGGMTFAERSTTKRALPSEFQLVSPAKKTK